jgi:hypothetical protein
MNPPVHSTSLGLVGNWQLLVAFLLRLACRPSGLSGRTPVGIPAREPRSLGHQRSLAFGHHSRWSLARTSFRQPLAPQRFVTTSDNSMSLRCLGSRSWRNGLGLWIGNGLGSGMSELRARLRYLLVLVCLWFCRLLSRSIAFVCLSLACLCLSLLVFASAVVRLVSDERPSIFRPWRSFCRRLYIRDVYVRSLSSPRSNSLSLLHSLEI